MKLNICIVWEQFEYGGVDSYLSYLINSWPEQNDKFTIIYNEGNSGAERLKNELVTFKNIRFIKYKSFFNYNSRVNFFSKISKLVRHIFLPIFFILNSIRLYFLIKGRKFDVLFAQNGGYPASYGVLTSIFSASIARVKVKLLVIHHAAVKPEIFTGWFRLLIERFFSNNLSRVICVSEATKKTVINFTRITDDQKCSAVVIPNGIPIEEYTPKKDHNTPILSVLMLGRLDNFKGHDDLLGAVSSLDIVLQKKIKIFFIGGFQLQQKKLIETLYTKMKIESELEIIGYDKRELKEIFENIDLLIMATKTFEGFGLTILEALNNGVPVISSKLGIATELFNETPNYLYDPGNVDELSEKLNEFLISDDKSIPQSTIKKLKKYDIKNIVKSYRNLMISEYFKKE